MVEADDGLDVGYACRVRQDVQAMGVHFGRKSKEIRVVVDVLDISVCF